MKLLINEINFITIFFKEWFLFLSKKPYTIQWETENKNKLQEISEKPKNLIPYYYFD